MPLYNKYGMWWGLVCRKFVPAAQILQVLEGHGGQYVKKIKEEEKNR